MAEQTGRDRREFYRLIYPVAVRPTIQVGAFVYEAFDVSEYGIKLLCDDLNFRLGQTILGTITFHDSMSYPIEGVVLRITRYEVILRLMKPIPERRMLDEQRFIINKYLKKNR